METFTHSTRETKEFAESVAKKIKEGDILALYGDLGSGKTTFVGYLVSALGSSSRVQSPTFVINRKYFSDKLKINHFDFYRLTSLEEVEDTGIKEMLQDLNSLTLIEWPELAEPLLPKKTIRIYFSYAGEDERKIEVQNLY